MGHDITANTVGEERRAIAEMSRGAFNEKARYIYEALGAQTHDCGVSGCGGEQTFTRAELEAALQRLPFDADNERDFLTETLASCGDSAVISFW